MLLVLFCRTHRCKLAPALFTCKHLAAPTVFSGSGHTVSGHTVSPGKSEFVMHQSNQVLIAGPNLL